MTGFPIANFSDSDQGLFSPEEIQSLMRIEFERAQRYRYPITLMMVEVDRLEYLHDLYGYESKEEILHAVISLLRSITRSSDFLGCMMDDRLMAVFPHTPEQAASSLAGRFLRGIRKLEFRSDGRLLRASLSIGIAVSQDDEEQDFDEFVQAAESALRFAVDSGGDRFVQRAAATAVIDELRRDLEEESRRLSRRAGPSHPAEGRRRPPAPEPSTPAPSPAAPETTGRSSPEPTRDEIEALLESLPPGSLAEKIHNLFAARAGSAEGLAGLEQEILSLSQSAVQAAQEEAIARTMSDHEGLVGRLERRVEKLKSVLDSTESELRRIAQLKGVETGVASIYRSVQGLSLEDDNFGKKKEMLSLIFEANVELRGKIDGNA